MKSQLNWITHKHILADFFLFCFFWTLSIPPSPNPNKEDYRENVHNQNSNFLIHKIIEGSPSGLPKESDFIEQIIVKVRYAGSLSLRYHVTERQKTVDTSSKQFAPTKLQIPRYQEKWKVVFRHESFKYWVWPKFVFCQPATGIRINRMGDRLPGYNYGFPLIKDHSKPRRNSHSRATCKSEKRGNVLPSLAKVSGPAIPLQVLSSQAWGADIVALRCRHFHLVNFAPWRNLPTIIILERIQNKSLRYLSFKLTK